MEFEQSFATPNIPFSLAQNIPHAVTRCYVERYSSTLRGVQVTIVDWLASHISPKPLFCLEDCPDAVEVPQIEFGFMSKMGREHVTMDAVKRQLRGEIVVICVPCSQGYPLEYAVTCARMFANSIRLVFGPAAAHHRLHCATYEKGSAGWDSQLYDFTMPHLTFPNVFEIASAKNLDLSGLSLNTSSVHFLDRVHSEMHSLDEKVLHLWTTLEAQLIGFAGRNSGQRRITFLREMKTSPLAQSKIKGIHEKRSKYLKEGSFHVFSYDDFSILYLVVLLSVFRQAPLNEHLRDVLDAHCAALEN